MTTLAPERIQVKLPSLHAGQEEIAEHPARFKVCACGRRYGKTLLGVCLCLRTAFHGGRVWWVAPTYKIAQEGWKALLSLVGQMPLSMRTIRESEMSVTFVTGGLIQVRSADNPWALRGAGLDGVVLDEAAFMDQEVWEESLRPALADKQGWALFISTPRGHNWFWELWEFAHGATDWNAWQRPTSDNPYIATGELEQTRSQMSPAAYAQEFEASFELIGNAVYDTFSRQTHCHRLPDLISQGRVTMTGKGAFGADYGVVDLSTICAVEVDSAGRRWVREVWGRPGGDSAEMDAARGQMENKYGRWSGRTDPTTGYIASRFNWNRAESGVQSGVKARDRRIGFVRGLLNIKPAISGALPGLCFDMTGPGVPELVREIEGYHFEEDSKGNLSICREAHKNDDRVAALEYAIEELENANRVAMPQPQKLTYGVRRPSGLVRV